jgi:Mce-associated membrane protein
MMNMTDQTLLSDQTSDLTGRPEPLPATGGAGAGAGAAPEGPGPDPGSDHPASSRWPKDLTGSWERAGQTSAWPARRARRRVLTVAVAAVVAALVVLLVLAGLSLRHDRQLSSARREATAAATAGALKISDYSYTSLANDFGSVKAVSTPAFAKQFAQSSQSLQKVLEKYHASSAGTVVASGVSSASVNKAVVLVFMTQTVRNSTTKTPSVERDQLAMTMVHQGGRWLISNVKLQ